MHRESQQTGRPIRPITDQRLRIIKPSSPCTDADRLGRDLAMCWIVGGSAIRRVVAFYNQRGKAEQYIKEGRNAIKGTRLSCRKFRDNAVRLQLHALAYNLADFMRTLALPKEVEHWSLPSNWPRLTCRGNRRRGEKCGRGTPGWRKIWENGLPGTANSPKSGYRTAAEGKPSQRRRSLGMIVMVFKAIWEKSLLLFPQSRQINSPRL